MIRIRNEKEEVGQLDESPIPAEDVVRPDLAGYVRAEKDITRAIAFMEPVCIAGQGGNGVESFGFVADDLEFLREVQEAPIILLTLTSSESLSLYPSNFFRILLFELTFGSLEYFSILLWNGKMIELSIWLHLAVMPANFEM